MDGFPSALVHGLASQNKRAVQAKKLTAFCQMPTVSSSNGMTNSSMGSGPKTHHDFLNLRCVELEVFGPSFKGIPKGRVMDPLENDRRQAL